MARTIMNATPASSVTAKTQSLLNTEGAVESVEDVVALIAPYETPFYSMLPKVQASDYVHYWQEDDLATPSRAGKAQGWEPSTASGADYQGSSPAMKQNRMQLFIRTARVSGSARAARFYGRSDELDYQKMKRGRELRRDIEAALLGATAPAAETTAAPTAGFPFGSAGTAGLMAGAPYLIRPGTVAGTDPNRVSGNHNVGATGDVTGTAGGAPGSSLTVTSGTNRAFTELHLLSAQKQASDQGGYPNIALMSPYHAAVMANFAYIDPTAGTGLNGGTRVRSLDGTDQNVINNVVDIYKSPYGTLAVMQDRFVQGYVSGDTANEGIVYLLESEKWHIAQLREMQTEDLAKTGDNQAALVLAECTLVHEHTGSSSVIWDLNTG